MEVTKCLKPSDKVRRTKGGSYPLSHLYETFGLIRLTRLGHDCRGRRREVLSESAVREIRLLRSMRGMWKRSYG